MENKLNDFESSFDVLRDVLAEDEETFVKIQPILYENLAAALNGAEMKDEVEKVLREYDMTGATLDEITSDMEMAKSTLYDKIVELKEQHTDSENKMEFLDMVYSMFETFFNVVVLHYSNRNGANVGIELLLETSKMPTYAHPGDQGADIYAPCDITVPANVRGFMVPTGLKMAIPHGWAVSIRPRSGMSKNTPLRISNSPATIDQQYRGEVKILFDNLSEEDYLIKAGDRIAQFILEKNYQAIFNQVDSVEPDTERGEGGFGSSGN